ncbi:hypothetical protein ACGF07_35360 [Kitasatospora sp. NPDC048194]|uniref:hypothetical protein n=1 Tax=Kitasatospora sp. NPDC048194 TaxID=3364045 RepID=UPI003712681F
MTFRFRRFLMASAFGALLAAATVPALALAASPGPDSAPVAATDPSLPPAAIEDFSYPGAAEIQQERNIKLIKGDGRLMLADCDPATPQIKVLSRNGDVCFRATGPGGYLTLEIARVFGLEAADRPISANLSVPGSTQTVSVDKGGYKSVGEGTIGGARSTLVELRVTG